MSALYEGCEKMNASGTVTVTRRYNFSWTEEQVQALLEREVQDYLTTILTGEERSKAVIAMTFGSRYEGGVDARASVEVAHTEGILK
jgi:hypothetical protein